LLHRLQLGGVPQEAVEQLLGGLGGEWVELQLGIIRLAAPRVLVPRAIADEE
jgi:hypothetical protein